MRHNVSWENNSLLHEQDFVPHIVVCMLESQFHECFTVLASPYILIHQDCAIVVWSIYDISFLHQVLHVHQTLHLVLCQDNFLNLLL